MTERNLVTPSDVGKRVSLRFALPNGHASEVVGVLERWDADAATYMVRGRDDAVVRVPLRDVRFGKVVAGTGV
jgi:hypothetical protein